MQDKTDDKLFDNRVFQEMLETEQSYNKALELLELALTMDTLVQDDPLLLELKKIVPILKSISDGLLANAKGTVNPDLTESEHNILRVQRTQLLTAFFKVYKNYAVIFDNYLTANNKYAIQYASSPKDNPFYKIDTYLAQYGNQLGLGAHLIQPIQRGPRYSLLVTEAAKSVSSEDENVKELETLKALISKELFDINSAMKPTAQTEGSWFRNITYTLLFGEPEKTPVKPEPTPVKAEEEVKPFYRFGDISRGAKNRLWNKLANTDKPSATASVKKSSGELVDEFTLVDEEDQDIDQKPENDEGTSPKGFGH